MRKNFIHFTLLAALALPALGQSQGAETASAPIVRFCDKDNRPEIREFCPDLARLQEQINQAKKSGEPITESNFANTLNHLDLSHPDARVKFITALAPRLVMQSAISKATASTAMADAEQQRVDQEFTPGSTSSGTTSLVSKAGSADLLSLALDTGALTRTINGTTAVLSTNADQIYRLITNDDPDCTVTCSTAGWFQNRVLGLITLSAGLNLAQTGNSTVPTTGQASGSTSTQVSSTTIPSGAGKLSSFTARYEVANKFDPHSKKFKDKWKNAVDKQKLGAATDKLKDSTDAITTTLTGAAPLNVSTILSAAQNDPSGAALDDAYAGYFADSSAKVAQDANIAAGVGKVMQDRALYRQAWFAALQEAAGTLLTFEYTFNRPANQPFTHDIKLIYANDFGDRGMLTFNGATSFYESIPSGANYGRLHYGQVSSEYDRTLSGKQSALQTQLTLAGYWQYQPHPSILNIPAGTTVPGTTIPVPNGTQEFVGTAGSLWVAQAKLTIKAAGGINLPIGVSWSNKTDLLQGSKIRGQVGISYNFSTLTRLFAGSGQ